MLLPAVSHRDTDQRLFTSDQLPPGTQSPGTDVPKSPPLVEALNHLIAYHSQYTREFSERIARPGNEWLHKMEQAMLHIQQQMLGSIAEYIEQRYDTTATYSPPVAAEEHPTKHVLKVAVLTFRDKCTQGFALHRSSDSTVHNQEGEGVECRINRAANRLANPFACLDEEQTKTKTIMFDPPQIKQPIHLLDRHGKRLDCAVKSASIFRDLFKRSLKRRLRQRSENDAGC